jgi:exonuclease SbcD
MPYSFGKEEKQEKSVTLIDTADMSCRILPLPLLHKRATLTGTMETLLSALCDEETRNGYVKLEITDQYADAEAAASLRSVYPNLLEFSGLRFDDTNASITLTADELEKMETDPVEVFRRFCLEVIRMEPDEHLTDLFRAALAPQEDDA